MLLFSTFLVIVVPLLLNVTFVYPLYTSDSTTNNTAVFVQSSSLNAEFLSKLVVSKIFCVSLSYL